MRVWILWWVLVHNSKWTRTNEYYNVDGPQVVLKCLYNCVHKLVEFGEVLLDLFMDKATESNFCFSKEQAGIESLNQLGRKIWKFSVSRKRQATRAVCELQMKNAYYFLNKLNAVSTKPLLCILFSNRLKLAFKKHPRIPLTSWTSASSCIPCV